MNMRPIGAGFCEHGPHGNLLRRGNASRIPDRSVRRASNIAGVRPGAARGETGLGEFFAAAVIFSRA